MLKTSLAALVLILFLATAALAQSNTSVYTNLTGRQCKTLKSTSAEGGSYEGQCPGVAGYKLLVQEGDLRQNIVVITPSGKKQSLELWNVVGSSFFLSGEKAEWRMKGRLTSGLDRALQRRQPEDSTKKGTSWLAVVRISSDASQICVTESIAPGADQNLKARAAADNSDVKTLQDK
jgi:hypothetical protein